MSARTISEEVVEEQLRKTMRTADLTTATPKSIRRTLEKFFGVKLKEKKEFLKAKCKEILLEPEFAALVESQIKGRETKKASPKVKEKLTNAARICREFGIDRKSPTSCYAKESLTLCNF